MDRCAGLRYLPYMTEIDAIGLRCPLPVLRLRRALRETQTVRLLADDAMAQIDVPHFCAEAGHRLINVTRAGDVFTFTVARAPDGDPQGCSH